MSFNWQSATTSGDFADFISANLKAMNGVKMNNRVNVFSVYISIFRVGLVVLSMLCADYAFAADDEWDYSKPYVTECYKHQGGGQITYNTCIALDLRKRESQLNDLYGKMSVELVEEGKLRESEVTWEKFRDSECALRLSGMDMHGSEAQFMKDACLLDLTIKRIKDLKLLDSMNGCNGCPVLKKDVR